MNFRNGVTRGLALVSFALVLLAASAASAQQFQLVKAEYGAGDRWVDVTRRLQDLARSNQTVQVSNAALGVDPAPGEPKVLRIDALGPRGVPQTFQFREGGRVDLAQFIDPRFDDRDRGGRRSGFQIVRAEYGSGDRVVDVTERFRDLVRTNRSFRVRNEAFGTDPAPNRPKTLRIEVLGDRGETLSLDYREGSMVDPSRFSAERYDDRDRREPVVGGAQYQIVRAEYGSDTRWVDVSARVRDLLRANRSFQASNGVFGVDPASGQPKVLRIEAVDSRGDRRVFTYPEGGLVDLSPFGDARPGDFGRPR